jgi:hypothetical protein
MGFETTPRGVVKLREELDTESNTSEARTEQEVQDNVQGREDYDTKGQTLIQDPPIARFFFRAP